MSSINLRLSPEVAEELRVYAFNNRVTVPDAIRLFIKNGLENSHVDALPSNISTKQQSDKPDDPF